MVNSISTVTRGNSDCDGEAMWIVARYQYCNGNGGDSDRDSDGESGNSYGLSS